jgi:hypothetical protein
MQLPETIGSADLESLECASIRDHPRSASALMTMARATAQPVKNVGQSPQLVRGVSFLIEFMLETMSGPT